MCIENVSLDISCYVRIEFVIFPYFLLVTALFFFLLSVASTLEALCRMTSQCVNLRCTHLLYIS